jgi:glycosyltransferase involved in cell wall biosynthesis
MGLQDRVYLPKPEVFPTGGLSREELAELYNMFDLYACPSTAEGFGIPLVEAQACGVPVVATKFSAMEELCSSGWFIEPITYYLTNMNAWRALPDIESIEERISHAYHNRDQVAQKGRVAREFSRQYEWHTVVSEGWLPALEVMERRLSRQQESVQGPRSIRPDVIPKPG